MTIQQPLSESKRAAIIQDLHAGHGRNATARRNRVGAGTVTNVARSIGHFFPACEHTWQGAQAQQIDQAAARIQREEALWETYLDTPLRHSGTLTRRAEKAGRAIDRLAARERRYRPLP